MASGRRGAGRVPLERIRRAAADVGRDVGARLVVLFGSAVREDGPEPEDLDIGVLGLEPIDVIDVTNRLVRALGVQEVDVVDLRRADPLLMVVVAREGVPLYESDPTEFACFVSLAARRYADTRKFREMERQEIRDFLARQGKAP
jgi:predicted nucleotidyltransferase